MVPFLANERSSRAARTEKVADDVFERYVPMARQMVHHRDVFSNGDGSSHLGGSTMLYWAGIFLIIGLIAGILGLAGVAGTATYMAYVLFVVFIVVAIISFIVGRRPPAGT